jgi:hypothetical protein
MSRVARPSPVSSPPPDEIEDDDEDLEQDDEMEEMMDPVEMLGNFLATDDGDTVATALVGLKDAADKIALTMEMQNKILVKMLSAVSKSGCACACRQPSTDAA